MITFVLVVTSFAAGFAMLSLMELAREVPEPPKPTKRSASVIAAVFWLTLAVWGAIIFVRELLP